MLIQAAIIVLKDKTITFILSIRNIVLSSTYRGFRCRWLSTGIAFLMLGSTDRPSVVPMMLKRIPFTVDVMYVGERMRNP